jgi:hypothetical protein
MPLMRALAAALALGVAGCASYYSTGMGGYVQHRTSPTMLWSEPGAPGAEMAPERKVSEQDCAAPIASATANLKCR